MMNCINCGKPIVGKAISVMGLFSICRPCESAGQRNEQLLKQGLEIEFVDPKTGKVVKEMFRS
jgi:hypothetical protein